MKSITEKINEALDPNIVVGLGSLLGAVAGSLAMYFGLSRIIDKHSYAWSQYCAHGSSFKNFLRMCKDDHKVEKILKRLKDDKDIQDFIDSKKTKGWRELISSKLSEDEIQYIYIELQEIE